MFQSLGNHEFDNGVSGLTPFIRNLSCPVLAANLVLNKEPELEAETNIEKSVAFDINGVKVGVIGYLTPETKVLAIKNNVEYIDEIPALIEEVTNLKSQGVNIIIALGHSGYKKDLEIAKEVEGLDLVIGGHTNTFLWNGTSPDSEKLDGPYPTVVTQASGKVVLVVQAYAYTKYLGKLHLIFNSKGEITSYDGQPLVLDNKIPQDTDLLQIIERYRSGVTNYTEQVVGNSSTVLEGLSCQVEECNLGNLITDAIIDKYTSQYKGKYWTDASIAIVQAGGIRASIERSQLPIVVTKGDLLQVMPFGGTLVTVTVNGTVILEMLEHSIASYFDGERYGEFLQFSGIKVVYDIKRPPNSRVIRAKARCSECDVPQYNDIEKHLNYKIIIGDFLSMGGDGFSMFKDLPSESLGYNELMCTTRYIQQHSPVNPKVEGRIMFLKTEMYDSSANIISLSSILCTSLIYILKVLF